MIKTVEPGRQITWRLRRWTELPVTLSVELVDGADGVTITHTIRAGHDGWGRWLDPIFQLYFSAVFAKAMDDHVRTEFPLLRDYLHRTAAQA